MLVRFYSTLREKKGKSVEINTEYINIKSLIDLLGISNYILDNNNLLAGTMILVNGKNISHLNGLDTIVQNSDSIDFFPPAAGG
ncbi:MAG: MoaD family protein [Desulfurella sp.]|jgi:molybdopterin synthase sulfur carrier subunit|uniref:Molybdopterin synthase sulfur carrier subunit n=1 Tax=Desulfurella multipotens TaxID=79269 RepID=A0A1G6MDF4_9BACT|nr:MULTISPECIES: MoaD family protein [Desulfurella]AHF96917.1 molybdopterin converting factor [Desulfurella acetivorans A63]PMP67785.1 MAG: MoaD/ThiS family protein [Desulfurella multipotens]PMP92639.1 MAG: MoaD/ThiS family protein [Desulfurella sp.]SDC53523.1 molybdopterin synthase sulfur carrier subunit [Desulfurella multipotens]